MAHAAAESVGMSSAAPPPPPLAAGPPGGGDLSAMQMQQLQQLQFQQAQWQFLTQLQQHQQQQAAAGGEFDPHAAAHHQAAAGTQQKAYQGYAPYPLYTQMQAPMAPPGAQQLIGFDEHGQPVYGGLPQGPVGADGSAGTGRSRYHNDQHAPSVDPDAWNGAITFPSKCNTDRYIAHRNYFSNIPPVINRLPRKPELKELVMRGREFYTNNREPRYYNPVLESGWDNRAAVVKTPITGTVLSPAQTWRHPDPATQQPLPTVEEAKDDFGRLPVLVDNGAASARPGSKLLVPFLHNWPPPFRFDFLKKHSRAPLSPFLASLNGYEVPAELYMSARQRAEHERNEAMLQQQQMEQHGYPNAYPVPPQDGQQDARPSPHSLDPIERARARANTHTTYWKTVAPAEETEGEGNHSQRPSSDRGGSKSSRPEWNHRHHVKPPQPRVGQTTAKKPPGRRDRIQQQLQAQQQQQQQQQQYALAQGAMLPPLMHNGQPYFLQPNGQPFAPYPYPYANPYQQSAYDQQLPYEQQQEQEPTGHESHDPTPAASSSDAQPTQHREDPTAAGDQEATSQ